MFNLSQIQMNSVEMPFYAGIPYDMENIYFCLTDHYEEKASSLRSQLYTAYPISAVSGPGFIHDPREGGREAELQGDGAAGRHCDAAYSK